MMENECFMIIIYYQIYANIICSIIYDYIYQYDHGILALSEDLTVLSE